MEDNLYKVKESTIIKFVAARRKLCKQEAYYNEKEIEKYLALEEGDFRSGSSTAFSIYHRLLHPSVSLFSRFDYRLKRLTRFTIFLGQICVVTLLQWFAYSSQFDKWGITDQIRSHRVFYVSLVLSLFMLPLPRKFLCCFETEMYLLKEQPLPPEIEEGDETEGKRKKKAKADLGADGEDN